MKFFPSFAHSISGPMNSHASGSGSGYARDNSQAWPDPCVNVNARVTPRLTMQPSIIE